MASYTNPYRLVLEHDLNVPLGLVNKAVELWK